MMQAIRNSARKTAAVTLIAFSFVVVAAPAAQAGIVGTQPALAGALDSDRAHLIATLNRADVRAQLVQRGVDPALVEARVAALTDDQVRDMNARIDSLPAGGELIGTLAFIFIILLITDLLGWTHVFPFTNKGAIGK